MTKFDLADKSTWPPKNEIVLWLCKDFQDKSLTFTGSINLDFDFFSINPCGQDGYECENDFADKDLFAWQPLPGWANLEKEIRT